LEYNLICNFIDSIVILLRYIFIILLFYYNKIISKYLSFFFNYLINSIVEYTLTFFLSQTYVFCLSCTHNRYNSYYFCFVLIRATCDTCTIGMLSKNFQVSCQILNNVTTNSLPVFHFSKKVSQNGKSIEWPENKIHLTSEQHQKKLGQYPSSLVQICCKKLFSESKPNVNRKLSNC